MSQIIQLPQRPGRSRELAQKCQQVTLVSNHYQIGADHDYRLFSYHLEITPEVKIENKKVLQQLVNSVERELSQDFGNNFIARGWYLWSIQKQQKVLKYNAFLQKKKTDERSSFQLKLTLDHEFDFREKGYTSFDGTQNPFTQVYNYKIRRLMQQMGYVEIGKNSKFYNPADIKKFKVVDNEKDYNMTVWRGFKTMASFCQKKIYCILDFSSRILRNETVLSYIDKFRNEREADENLKGISVMCMYGNGNRIYKVDSIAWDLNPTTEFQGANEQWMSLIEYFQQKYQITIQDHKQPLIRHFDKKTNRELLLIPELLNVTGLNDQMRSDWRLMKAVAEHTKIEPNQRLNILDNHAKELQRSQQSVNIAIQELSQEVRGHLMNQPTIKLDRKEIQCQKGEFRLRDPLYQAAKFQNWVLIYQSRKNEDDEQADNFVDLLQETARNYGIQINNPGFIAVKGNNDHQWIIELDKDIKAHGLPQIVVSLIQKHQKNNIYPMLKNFLYTDKGIPHQNVIVTSLKRNQMSVCSKIICQMNAKLGCPLWATPKPKEISDRTMIVGIDIYHKLLRDQKSLVGFVSSTNSEFSKYYSKIIIQKQGKQVLQAISDEICNACCIYAEKNQKQLPDTVIVFRDGVSEGQLQGVAQLEVQAIIDGFKMVVKSGQYNPFFAEIVVNRKPYHRFFLDAKDAKFSQNQNQGNRNQQQQQFLNPESGTIIADTVTTSNFDFLLCAQNVTQGTCTPTQFNVIHNDTELSEDTFWELAFNQCFNYFNWTGAVRVPAPCQYAHKLAYLVGETFQDQPHESLDDCLYYL